MSDLEKPAAEPAAEGINTSLGKASQTKKYQPSGQPHCWLHLLGRKLQAASPEVKVKERHNHFT